MDSFNSSYSYNITYTDDSGLWLNIWNSLKSHLNVHFISIKFKDYTAMRPLSSINIKMIPYNEDISNMNFYIIKVNNLNEFKQNKDKIILNSEKKKNLILLMDFDNTDNSIKNNLKIYEKIKNELKNFELKLLPTNPNINKATEIINNFLSDLKQKISNDMINKMSSYNKSIEMMKYSKNDTLESTYDYLNLVDRLTNYLFLSELWEEILKIMEDDLLYNFSYLNHNNKFVETPSFIDYNENIVRKKISEKNLSNIEYQQYIIILIIRCCKYSRGFIKLNYYISKILSEISNLRIFFGSNYHFTFWCYLLTSRFIPFLKSLKSSLYTHQDEDNNLRGQLNILYYMKKFMKGYASLIKLEIPKFKLFSLLLNINNENEVSDVIKAYVNKVEEKSDEFLKENELYHHFIKDIQNTVDDKISCLVLNKSNMYLEYLNILNNIENIHTQLKLNHLTLKTQFEITIISLILPNLNLIMMRDFLLNVLNYIDRWNYMTNIFSCLLVIILNTMEKNIENLDYMVKMLHKRFKINQNMICEENLIYDIMSHYLLKEFNSKHLIDFNYIIIAKILINETESNVLVNSEKTIRINLQIENTSKVTFNFKEIILVLYNETELEEVNFNYNNDKFNVLYPEKITTHNYDIDLGLIKNNSIFTIKKILFTFSENIKAYYNITNSQKIEIRNNILSVKSYVYNTDENNINLINSNNLNLLFFNSLYKFDIQLNNFNHMSFENKTRIYLKFNKNFKFRVLKTCLNNKNNFIFNIKDSDEDKGTKIFEFDENYKFINDINIINIDFFIEDDNYNLIDDFHLNIIIEVIDSESGIEFCILKDSNKYLIQHLFIISNKLKVYNDGILTQINLNMNPNFNNASIILNDMINELFEFKTFSIVKYISRNICKEDIQNLNFEFIFDKINFKYHYPFDKIFSDILKLLNLSYHINISIDIFLDSDGFEINKPLTINTRVNYYKKEDVYIMFKIKDTEGWVVIGKSRLIEKLSSDSISVSFKILPIHDGYLKLPEIELMEYKVNNSDGFKNVNSLEFLPLTNDSIIEGNEKIIKIYSNNSCSLRLNIL